MNQIKFAQLVCCGCEYTRSCNLSSTEEEILSAHCKQSASIPFNNKFQNIFQCKFDNFQLKAKPRPCSPEVEILKWRKQIFWTTPDNKMIDIGDRLPGYCFKKETIHHFLFSCKKLLKKFQYRRASFFQEKDFRYSNMTRVFLY